MARASLFVKAAPDQPSSVFRPFFFPFHHLMLLLCGFPRQEDDNHMSTASATSECPLLQLPPELILDITRYLPLASLLIFRLQLCRTLRNRLGPLRFNPPHRFSFVEWQKVAEEWQRIGIVKRDDDEDEVPIAADRNIVSSSSSRSNQDYLPALEQVGWTGAPTLIYRAERLDAALGVMLQSGAVQEARLTRRIFAFLGLIPSEAAIPPKGATRPGRTGPPRKMTPLKEGLRPWSSVDGSAIEGQTHLTSISLISWNGYSGESLAHFLKTYPAFARVNMIVKTDRFDLEAWNTDFDQKPPDQEENRPTRPPRYDDENLILPLLSSPSLINTPTIYTETQVAVQVGSKAPADLNIKGRGIYAGLKGYCWATSTTTPSNQRRPLHLLFQGRFHLSEADETEEMLSYSHIRCNACQATLQF